MEGWGWVRVKSHATSRDIYFVFSFILLCYSTVDASRLTRRFHVQHWDLTLSFHSRHAMAQPPLPLTTIYAAYNQLKIDVNVALNTQIGDSARLQEHSRICTHFQQNIEQVRCFVYIFKAVY